MVGPDRKKSVAYFLLVIGISIMVFVAISVGMVFTGTNEVPIEIFSSVTSEGELIEIPEINNTALNLSFPEMNLNALSKSLDIFPLFNLFAWLGIAFLLIYVGYKFSSLGWEILQKCTKEERKKEFEQINYQRYNYGPNPPI